MSLQSDSLAELNGIIAALLAPDGCPWDREQTPASLCDYVLEEAHELVEAIRHGSVADACEELGDVFFLLAFLGALYEESNKFTLDDALKTVCAKMIRRHPHVFDSATFTDRQEQLRAWERIKQLEKQGRGDDAPKGMFSSLPKGLPPLLKAYRIHSKAARADFTWDSDQDVELQVEAEWVELVDALQNGTKEAQEHELGDILFTLVELGRRKGIKASAALDATCHRFLTRFARMEDLSRQQGKEFSAVSMEEKNALWETAKSEEKQAPPAVE